MWKHSFLSFSHLFTLPPPHPALSSYPPQQPNATALYFLSDTTLYFLSETALYFLSETALYFLSDTDFYFLLNTALYFLSDIALYFLLVIELAIALVQLLPGSCGNILELGWHSTHLDWLRDNGR